MNEVRNRMLEYVTSKAPREFRGKENWLGVRMSPHSPMCFINKITAEGVETSEGNYTWKDVPQNVLSTLYQRLKINEA